MKAVTIPVKKKTDLHEIIFATTFFVWFISALVIFFWAESLLKSSEFSEAENPRIETTVSDFAVAKNLENVTGVKKLLVEYYEDVNSYDYTNDRFGDKQGPSIGKDTILNLALVVVCFFIAFCALVPLEKRPKNLVANLIFFLFISAPIAVNVCKASFLYWISH